MNKIKFGYQQNPEAYEQTEELLMRYKGKKIGFLEKMAEEGDNSRVR